MITQPSFLSLSSFEKLRTKELAKSTIFSLLDMGRGIFGIDFGSTSFVIKNNKIKNYVGTYFRLKQRIFQYIDPVHISEMYLKSKQNREYRIDFSKYDTNTEIEKCESQNGQLIYYESNSDNFTKIPGSPVAYWVSENFIRMYSNPLFYDYTISDGQNKTGNNARFVRMFWEVSNKKIGKDRKWLFYAKGGGYRKWIGNLIDVVNWSESARSFYRKDHICRIIPEYLWYKKGITWGLITSNLPSFRVLPEEATFDVGGSSVFFRDYANYNYFLGLLNSKTFLETVKISNPTLNFQVKDIRSMPIIIKNEEMVNTLVEENIQLSKDDWDSYETSWDFERHPLIRCMSFSREEVLRDKEHFINDLNYIENAFVNWSNECYLRFEQLKDNEEELNRIFIDIYGLQDELTPEVADKDVTVRKADLTREIKSLISYAVGCMFGRYSIDVDGLAYAGGEWDSTKYKTFIPDDDNCIPITDTRYFEDDIVGRFVEFVKVVYGEDTLEENLDFIAQALGNKGNSSREIIRNYFLNDFFKDHCKIYQKRPIYWLFDSGKQNGFKALIYMHRYNADTIGNLRVEYLHKVQRIYESEIEREQDTIDNTKNPREKKASENRKEKLQRQLKETKEYDAKIAHIALSRIEIDLDDGVKVNYDKVQTSRDGKKLEILAKI